jgi:hypothetical protein
MNSEMVETHMNFAARHSTTDLKAVTPNGGTSRSYVYHY